MLSLLLAVAGRGKDLWEVLVFVRRVKLVCVFLVHKAVCVCESMCCRGFVLLCRGVFVECRGSERHESYILMEHTGPFSCTWRHTHACAPVQPHRRSSLCIETNRLIHATQGLNVIKIYRSGPFSPVTDRHSSTFGSGLGTLIRGTSKWVSDTFQWNWDEQCISKVGFQKWFNFQ